MTARNHQPVPETAASAIPPKPPAQGQRVLAAHPHWTGYLVLSPDDAVVTHEESGNRGRYERTADGIAVAWDRFGHETFRNVSGVLTHESLIGDLASTKTLATRIGPQLFAVTRFNVRLPGSDHDVGLRPGTTDIAVFEKIFIDREYEAPDMPEAVETIVDLGANVGLSAVYFALRYPLAHLLAVEPGDANFALLEANTMPFGDRVRRLKRAAWSFDGEIDLRVEDEDQQPLGAWGLRVGEGLGRAGHMVPCARVDTMCAAVGFHAIDILKVDIEGAELDVFSQGAASWLRHTRFIVIETHDRFRPGSEAAVRAAVRAEFEELPPMGEHLLFRRKR